MLKDIIYRLQLSGESFTLQKRDLNTQRDEITGDFSHKWTDNVTLTGIIRGESTYKDNRGEEEVPVLRAYFLPDFEAPIGELSEYRIKHTTSNGTYYRQIFKIDRDLRLKNKRHHYKMLLGKNPKWGGTN